MQDFVHQQYQPDTKSSTLSPQSLLLEASKGGTKVGRMKDPLYKDSYLGINPPSFILPFEAPDPTAHRLGMRHGRPAWVVLHAFGDLSDAIFSGFQFRVQKARCMGTYGRQHHAS